MQQNGGISQKVWRRSGNVLKWDVASKIHRGRHTQIGVGVGGGRWGAGSQIVRDRERKIQDLKPRWALKFSEACFFLKWNVLTPSQVNMCMCSVYVCVWDREWDAQVRWRWWCQVIIGIRRKGGWAGWPLPCRSCCRSKLYFFLTWPIEVNKPSLKWSSGNDGDEALYKRVFNGLMSLHYSIYHICSFEIFTSLVQSNMQRQDTIRYLNFKCSSSCQNVVMCPLGCPFHGTMWCSARMGALKYYRLNNMMASMYI